MGLLNVSSEIEKRLEMLDFPALLRGFHRFPFALYDDAQAVIGGERIEKPAEFIANTSVLFRGAQTAIWMVRVSFDGLATLKRCRNSVKSADSTPAYRTIPSTEYCSERSMSPPPFS